MKIYRIIIKPTSPFGTLLKGDTIFGHFCWQAAQDGNLLTGGLEEWIDCYTEKPFAVFSSAFPVINMENRQFYALPRPLWNSKISERGDRRTRILRNKEAKRKKYLLLDPSLEINLERADMKSEAELFTLFTGNLKKEESGSLRQLDRNKRKVCMSMVQNHNTINRQTMTTGDGQFAPFSHDNYLFLPGLSLAVFVAVDQQAMDSENLRKGFTQIGQWGYGRDAACGLGRFTVESVEEHVWPKAGTKTESCYTLAPCVPQKKTFARCHATPFTRFGRHGGPLAVSGKPFKAPVIMADEGAILYPGKTDVFEKPYLGSAITDISSADPRTVAQGYSLYLPC